MYLTNESANQRKHEGKKILLGDWLMTSIYIRGNFPTFFFRKIAVQCLSEHFWIQVMKSEVTVGSKSRLAKLSLSLVTVRMKKKHLRPQAFFVESECSRFFQLTAPLQLFSLSVPPPPNPPPSDTFVSDSDLTQTSPISTSEAVSICVSLFL